MARRFAGSTSTDKIAFASITPSTLRSISVWFYIDAIDSTPRRIYEWGGGSVPTHRDLFFVDAAGEENTRLTVGWSTTGGAWEIANPSTGTWHHLLVTYDGGATTNDPVIYIDGVSQSITEQATPAGTLNSASETLNIGNRSDSTRAWNGAIAEYGRWERILNAGEISALARGFSPLFFDPSFYAPLIGRNSPETQPVSSTTGTVTGAVADPHPRIIYPRRGR